MSTGTLTPRGRHHRTETALLPEAPDDREKAWHPRPVAGWLAPAGLAAAACYLVAAQAWLEWHDPPLVLFGWYTALFAVSQAVIIPVLLAALPFRLDAHARAVRSWRPSRYPDVDIYLPVCGEPAAVLRNTWAGVASLLRTYPGRVHPFVLDDGPGEPVMALAAQFGFAYLRRPDVRQDGKGGNLNHALGRTVSPFIAVFHADSRPRADFLTETLPYFADPAVGIVQTPLFFRPPPGRSPAARAAGPVLAAARRVTQSSRDRFAAAQCTGCAAVYRRMAIVSAGGFSPAAPAAETRTTLAAKASGYRSVYLPLPLAAGLCPALAPAFARQQYQAATDAIAAVCSRPAWRVRLGTAERLRYLGSFAQRVLAGLRVVLLPLVPVVGLAALPAGGRAGSLLAVGWPALACAVVLYPVWQVAPPARQASWQLLPLAGWAQLLASWDYLRTRAGTPDQARTDRTLLRRCLAGLAGWNLVLGVAWLALACWRFAEAGSWASAVLAVLGLGYTGLVGRLTAEVLTSAAHRTRPARVANA